MPSSKRAKVTSGVKRFRSKRRAMRSAKVAFCAWPQASKVVDQIQTPESNRMTFGSKIPSFLYRNDVGVFLRFRVKGQRKRDYVLKIQEKKINSISLLWRVSLMSC